MLKLLHFSDIHLGSSFNHGHINPATGFNTRLEDFVQTLTRCIDRAIAEPVDLVLFGGDAFPDATPPPYVQEAFASQFRRLADAQIPTVLLVGNHDQHSQGQGGASLCIYRTLGVPGFVVGDRLETHPIPTRHGTVQVITLPWITRSTLLTRPNTEGLSMGEVNQLLSDRLRVALEGEIRQLDPTLPTVLLAHAMVDTATYGAERFLAVGKGFTIPLALLSRDCFDYVALGHVHRHQILCDRPPVVYPGSIERVDFSEEKEEKGFVLVNLAKGQTTLEFCPLPVRPFRTIKVDLSQPKPPQTARSRAKGSQTTASQTTDSKIKGSQTKTAQITDPQTILLKALKPELIQDAVVRLIYQVRSDQLAQIDNRILHQALAPAHSYTIHPELVSQLARARIPELGEGSHLDPLEALKTYLANRNDLRELETNILDAAQALLGNESIHLPDPEKLPSAALSTPAQPCPEPYPQEQQLRLL